MKRIRLGYMLAAVTVVAVAGVFTWAVLNSKRVARDAESVPPSPAAPAEPDETRLQLDDLQLSDHDEEGNLRWRITSSGTLDFSRDRMVVQGTDIKWELARPDEDVLVLEAPQFLLDWPEKRLALEQGVQARSAAGDFSFSAAHVHYDLEAERLHAREGVRAHLGEYFLEAGQLAFDRLGREVALEDTVVLEYQDYRVTAQTAQVDTARRHATLTGRPRLTGGGYTASAATMHVDGPSEQVRLTGNVHVQRGKELSARAPRGTFDRNAQRARMEGGVKVTGEGFDGTGRTLVVDSRTGELTLSGGVNVNTEIGW